MKGAEGFDISKEYGIDSPSNPVFNEASSASAEASEKKAQQEMESIPIPADKLAEVRGLLADANYDGVGRIISNLI